MKVNPKIYNIATTDPLEIQEVEGHKVEIFCLNDYPDVMTNFTNRGKFAVWSSMDGYDYRLFIEEGYHKTLRELYGKRVNTIWLKFWDDCERITSRFTKRFVLPATILILAIYFGLYASGVIPNEYLTVFSIAVPGTFIILMLAMRRYTNQKISQKNAEAIDEIKKILGAEKFSALLEAQRGYIDEFFGYNNEEEEKEEALATEEVVETPQIEGEQKQLETSSEETKTKEKEE